MSNDHHGFSLKKNINILQQTPYIVSNLFDGLEHDLIHSSISQSLWSPYEILAHLIYNDKVNWLPRIKRILIEEKREFEPFVQDRFLKDLRYDKLPEMINEFEKVREDNINRLINFEIPPIKLKMTAIHPVLGEVTLQQLLATWLVHDLSHLSQILRVVSNQFKNQVGPWIKYLRILWGMS